MYEVRRHLWRTKDGRLVPTGHIDAQILAYAKGDHLADEIAAREGLTIGPAHAAEVEPVGEPEVAEVLPTGDVVLDEVVGPVPTTVTPVEPVEDDPTTPPVRRTRRKPPAKKVSGVTINRISGGSADG